MEPVSADQLLREADFVSLHVPLMAETRHLIGARELRMMKPTAILVNTSRGPVVDEPALAGALAQRVIAGAGIDVYEHEPQVDPGLLRLENVVPVSYTHLSDSRSNCSALTSSSPSSFSTASAARVVS